MFIKKYSPKLFESRNITMKKIGKNIRAVLICLSAILMELSVAFIVLMN
ncbi:MAG: hypothetical protein M0Z72_00580 [Deltaproteobacteria bacterium]|nr:hypothetical protein [Deltaproteobacteria bacterium]